MMSDNDLIFTSFELAAELHGDITDVVCDDLFRHYPKAADCFLLRGEQFAQELKQQMVRDSIYAFLEYLETPEEVEISFKYTIPQHQILNIPLQYIIALMQSVANVATASVPPEQHDVTKQQWDTVMQAFSTMINAYEE